MRFSCYNIFKLYGEVIILKSHKIMISVMFILILLLTGCTEAIASFEINFDTNGGSDIDVLIVNGLMGTAMPEDPTKEGYVFDGWFLDDDTFETPFNVDNILNLELTEDITVYAKWIEEVIEPNIWTVTFNYNDGVTSAYNVIIDESTIVGMPTNPTRAGYVFDGWYIDNDTFESSFTLDDMLALSSDMSVYAKWVEEVIEPNTWTVTFDYNDGVTNTVSVHVSDGEYVDEPIDPERIGYIFNGWYLNDVLYNFSETEVLDHMSLVSSWQTITYNITYMLDGGIQNENNLNTYTVEDLLTFQDPNKAGFDFDGWYVDASFTESLASYHESHPVGDLTVYAKWIEVIPDETLISYQALNEDVASYEELDHSADPSSIVKKSALYDASDVLMGYAIESYRTNNFGSMRVLLIVDTNGVVTSATFLSLQQTRYLDVTRANLQLYVGENITVENNIDFTSGATVSLTTLQLLIEDCGTAMGNMTS